MIKTSHSKTVTGNEPVTLDELKLLIKDTPVADDPYLVALITMARETAENMTGRSFMSTTNVLVFNQFPCGDTQYKRSIIIDNPPVITVSSITYIDTNGDSQTLSTDYYAVHSDQHGTKITEKYGKTWPSTRCQPDAVTINYTSGYAAVPETVKLAIKFLAQMAYESLRKEDNDAALAQVNSFLEPYVTVKI